MTYHRASKEQHEKFMKYWGRLRELDMTRCRDVAIRAGYRDSTHPHQVFKSHQRDSEQAAQWISTKKMEGLLFETLFELDKIKYGVPAATAIRAVTRAMKPEPEPEPEPAGPASSQPELELDDSRAPERSHRERLMGAASDYALKAAEALAGYLANGARGFERPGLEERRDELLSIARELRP